MSAEHFGTALDGSPVHRVHLTRGGMRASIMSWGASLQDLRREGTAHSLVLGSPDFAPYLGPMRYFGAICGRVANRIALGRAPLDGRILELERNENGATTLHGGSQGTPCRNWQLDGSDAASARFTITLPDGDAGFPGNIDISATYALAEDGALEVTLEAETDAPTFCNLAHHAYWNLDGTPDLSGHRMQIEAERYLPVDAALIPLGTPEAVAGTGFDFRAARSVLGEPLDHNFCLTDAIGPMRRACTLSAAGLALDIETTDPGLQVYDGAGLNTGVVPTHAGRPYGAHGGLAIEPQRWPDAPNQPSYPSVRLDPSERYHQHSIFRIRPEATATGAPA